MVMDANQQQQPSPQSVGREFVRQYYTLLNKAPEQLHRFYNHNSSFIHDESTLYIGQKNIHNRIQQLNFNDCHAKISQVDSQATLGNGVVVQVTGELSNDGQPMRRFTQTFVLAAQSPKKYYVHNDIFRYQDVYSDEENDGDLRPELEEEHEHRGTSAAPGMGGAITNDQQTQVAMSGEMPQVANILTAAPVVAAQNSAVLAQQPQAPTGHQQFYISLPTAGGPGVPVIAASAPPQGAVPLAAQYATSPNSGVAAQVQAAAGGPQLNGVVSHEDLSSGIIYQNNQANAPVAGAQQLMPQNTSPVVASAAGVPVANAQVLTAAHNLGAVAVPLAATAVAPSAGSAMPPAGFKNAALIQPQVMQPIPQTMPQVSQVQMGAISPQSQQSEYASNNQAMAASPIPSNAADNNDENRNSNVATPTLNEAPAPQASVVEPAVRRSPVVEDFKTITEQQQQEKLEQTKAQQQLHGGNQNHGHMQMSHHSQQTMLMSEPKTYANLFKSSATPSFVSMSSSSVQPQPQQSNNTMYNSNSTSNNNTYASNTNNSFNRNNNENNSSNMNNNSGGQNALPQRNSQPRLNKDFDQRRSSNSFVDNQQLFLGNIPHHASEDDLKALFSRFGTVLELRILSKQNGKVPPGVRNPLNYGFITYEDAESVQYCLANCPLYFPEDSPDRQKLNVEEKKPRNLRNDLAPRQGGGGGGNNMNNMNSQRNAGNGGGAAGHSSRSISNSSNVGGGMLRGGSNNNSNSMSRGNSGGGPRPMGGGFHRNDNRNSSQMRGGGGNNAQSGGSGGNYTRR